MTAQTAITIATAHAVAPLTVPCPACGATCDKHDQRVDDLIAYRCRNANCRFRHVWVDTTKGWRA